MILIVFLLAPTVPSEPRPQKTARVTSSASVSKLASTSSEVCVTSSVIPTVKWFFGRSSERLSRTALTIAGVNSFDESP